MELWQTSKLNPTETNVRSLVQRYETLSNVSKRSKLTKATSFPNVASMRDSDSMNQPKWRRKDDTKRSARNLYSECSELRAIADIRWNANEIAGKLRKPGQETISYISYLNTIVELLITLGEIESNGNSSVQQEKLATFEILRSCYSHVKNRIEVVNEPLVPLTNGAGTQATTYLEEIVPPKITNLRKLFQTDNSTQEISPYKNKYYTKNLDTYEYTSYEALQGIILKENNSRSSEPLGSSSENNRESENISDKTHKERKINENDFFEKFNKILKNKSSEEIFDDGTIQNNEIKTPEKLPVYTVKNEINLQVNSPSEPQRSYDNTNGECENVNIKATINKLAGYYKTFDVEDTSETYNFQETSTECDEPRRNYDNTNGECENVNIKDTMNKLAGYYKTFAVEDTSKTDNFQETSAESDEVYTVTAGTKTKPLENTVFTTSQKQNESSEEHQKSRKNANDCYQDNEISEFQETSTDCDQVYANNADTDINTQDSAQRKPSNNSEEKENVKGPLFKELLDGSETDNTLEDFDKYFKEYTAADADLSLQVDEAVEKMNRDSKTKDTTKNLAKPNADANIKTQESTQRKPSKSSEEKEKPIIKDSSFNEDVSDEPSNDNQTDKTLEEFDKYFRKSSVDDEDLSLQIDKAVDEMVQGSENKVKTDDVAKLKEAYTDNADTIIKTQEPAQEELSKSSEETQKPTVKGCLFNEEVFEELLGDTQTDNTLEEFDKYFRETSVEDEDLSLQIDKAVDKMIQGSENKVKTENVAKLKEAYTDNADTIIKTQEPAQEELSKSSEETQKPTVKDCLFNEEMFEELLGDTQTDNTSEEFDKYFRETSVEDEDLSLQIDKAVDEMIRGSENKVKTENVAKVKEAYTDNADTIIKAQEPAQEELSKSSEETQKPTVKDCLFNEESFEELLDDNQTDNTLEEFEKYFQESKVEDLSLLLDETVDKMIQSSETKDKTKPKN